MSVPKRSREAAFTVPRRRVLGPLAALSLAAGVLTACGSSGGVPTLTWYINPDSGGQAAIAKNCSTDQYKIATQVLPQDATQQRVQLARRLAAHDSGIDLMSLDPPFTAEIRNAGFLAPIPQDVQDQLKQQSFKGAVAAGTWNNQLVVFPFWSNTQVLWYRKSFVQKAGIDMNKPVTWDQIITTASKNGGQIGVQANKYEGYSVWINALISGAGGQVISDAHKGADATIDVNSPAGDDAAGVINKLAHSSAAPPDLSVSNEGTAGSTFGSPAGVVHGELDVHLPQLRLDPAGRRQGHRLHPVPGDRGRASLPAAVRRHRHRGQRLLAATWTTPSRPPSAWSARRTRASTPSSPATCRRAPPATSTRRSRSSTRPRCWPSSSRASTLLHRGRSLRYWSDISSALQNTWHPPASVNSEHPREVRELHASRY